MSLMLSCTSALVEEDLPPDNEIRINMVAGYTGIGDLGTRGWGRPGSPIPMGSLLNDGPINGAQLDILNALSVNPEPNINNLLTIGLDIISGTPIHPQNLFTQVSISGIFITGGQQTQVFTSASAVYFENLWSYPDPLGGTIPRFIEGNTYECFWEW